ncbi:MAG: hypothetical protein K2G25_03695 [Oscillospiraceae bacterium]|nr:hypothetical protein [Oscillospiraceae bacterium]
MENKIFLEIANKIKCERPAVGTSWVRSADTLIADKRLTPTAIRVYNALLDMCTEANNIIRISYNQLKKRVFCCEKSIYNALNRLYQCRYIEQMPKAWATEINAFEVFKILPDKKRNKSKSGEQPDSMPEIQSKPRKPRAEKPKKKKYGKYNRVRLTDEEYNSLVNDFGQEIVEAYIQRADDYSKEHKRYYNNNAETIRKWIEQDRNKPGSAANHKYSIKHAKYNFHDKTYRDLIEELPEEKRAYYYQKVFPKQLDKIAKLSLDDLVDSNSYMSLGKSYAPTGKSEEEIWLDVWNAMPEEEKVESHPLYPFVLKAREKIGRKDDS